MNSNMFNHLNPKYVRDLKILLKSDELRLQVYKYMLESLDSRSFSGYSLGFCHCVPDFIKFVDDDRISLRLKVLPELWAYKPKEERNDSYWFDERDSDTRIHILENIIITMSK